MGSPEGPEFQAYLDQLIESTRNGSMRWVEVNPTTFSWLVPSPRQARLLLQRVERNVPTAVPGGRTTVTKKISYVFQAFDQNNPRISVDSFENAELTKKLEVLFELIRSAAIRADLDFLKSILPPKGTA